VGDGLRIRVITGVSYSKKQTVQSALTGKLQGSAGTQPGLIEGGSSGRKNTIEIEISSGGLQRIEKLAGCVQATLKSEGPVKTSQRGESSQGGVQLFGGPLRTCRGSGKSASSGNKEGKKNCQCGAHEGCVHGGEK